MTSSRAARARLALAHALRGPCIAVVFCGCGGALPLLHPAQTLPQGEVRASAGLSGEVATLGLTDALHGATSGQQVSPPSAVRTDPAFAKGALVAASVTPGLAPMIGARVGLGQSFEGGLAYTGRAVRADARRAFDLTSHWALSLGIGGSAPFDGQQANGALPGADLQRVHGWGADLPVLVGYASDAGLYQLWLGVRGGWEEVHVDAPVSLSATRFSGGALLGLAVGFRHVHVAMEIEASYATISGDYAGTHGQVDGITLAPAACLWWEF